MNQTTHLIDLDPDKAHQEVQHNSKNQASMKSCSSDLVIRTLCLGKSRILTNGAGTSSTNAKVERERVIIWRMGRSTMIATNGRAFAPGLSVNAGSAPSTHEGQGLT
jgi:hypothetical protein